LAFRPKSYCDDAILNSETSRQEKKGQTNEKHSRKCKNIKTVLNLVARSHISLCMDKNTLLSSLAMVPLCNSPKLVGS